SNTITNFGTASLWPIYIYIGNLSKYIHGLPTSFAAHHLAYMPSVCTRLDRRYIQGEAPSVSILTHLKRELIHAIWELLMDEEFMHAYKHGIINKCADGIIRHVFPRFFTYGADYPEKVLIATIKSLGRCPCPWCFVRKDQIGDLGTANDMKHHENICTDSQDRQEKAKTARKGIFQKGHAVASNVFNTLLGVTSMVPTHNAFSHRLANFGFNFHTMLVPDLLHEFELGMWKAVFTHLICILQAVSSDSVTAKCPHLER
ncbi:hypothetical protein K443DRAFT_92736, partial [Laccaria amethystina LaAM-08-1]